MEMATAVFGGSPRHHNRIMVNSGSNTSNISHHLTHSSLLQPSTPIISGVSSSSSSVTTANNIIFPPTSFISAAPPPPLPPHHYHHHTLQHHHTHNSNSISRHSKHRTSAVELLAASKPLYVKTETVLDRQQQLNYRSSSGGNQQLPPPPTCNMSPSRTPILHHRSSSSRRSTSSSSDMLQNKLRNLLNSSGDSSKDLPDHNTKYKAESPNYDINKYMSPKKLSHDLTVHSDSNNDVSVFFPSAFLSPQSLPPNPASDDDIYSYAIDESLMLTDDYQTISPPAEYAENNSSRRGSNNIRYTGYQRSYSHSQAVQPNESDNSNSFNINSHKSLPDLHSQISRHSPHSEALSCCSRGNRSNKSGSSFNRDSGGSSGHYTHRSEPCCKQQQQQQQQQQQHQQDAAQTNTDFRRDSGSSTQHSGNSYYAYGIPPIRYDCMECRAKIQNDANCLLNFTTPEVPEAFQDDYQMEKSRRYYDESTNNVSSNPSKYYKTQLATSPKSKQPDSLPVIPQQHMPQDTELSPPLGTFKRQRCFRIKQRSRYASPNDRNCRSEDDRRPILRSKSDISDRYWHRNTLQYSDKLTQQQQRNKSESMSQLERFFDRLGLNEENYDEYIAPKSQYNSDTDSDHSSPIFFSDASTVDSNRLPDSTEVPPNNAPSYRPSEPPSIVERNARIIKWLCNCRKLQLT